MRNAEEYMYIYENGESMSAVVSINYNLIQNCVFKNIQMKININNMIVVFKNIPLLNNFKFGCVAVINKSFIHKCTLDNISITSPENTIGFCSAVACINEGGIVGLKIDNININGDTASCISYLNSGTIKELDIGKQITLNHNKFSSIISIYNYNNLNTVISCIKLFKTIYDKYGITQDDRKQYNNIYILNEDGLINDIINEDKINLCSIGMFGSLKRQAILPAPPTIPVTTPVDTPPPETPKSNKNNYGLLIGLPIGILVALFGIAFMVFVMTYNYNKSFRRMVDKLF
jgi:hypothetical protein